MGTHSTLAAAGGKVIIQRPKGVSLTLGYINGTDIYAGLLVTGADMTDPDLNLIDAAHEEVSGVAVRMVGTAAATAPDTAFSDNEPFEYAGTGTGIVCFVKFTSNAGWYPGQVLISAGDGTGQSTLTAGVTANNATSFMNHFKDVFGRGAEYQATTTSGSYTYVYAQVRLSI